MININTKEYWDDRFGSGNWGRGGRRQTFEYAKANVDQLRIPEDFNGTILDFGCALGDAIPVYKTKFSKEGEDISRLTNLNLSLGKSKGKFAYADELSPFGERS